MATYYNGSESRTKKIQKKKNSKNTSKSIQIHSKNPQQSLQIKPHAAQEKSTTPQSIIKSQTLSILHQKYHKKTHKNHHNQHNGSDRRSEKITHPYRWAVAASSSLRRRRKTGWSRRRMRVIEMQLKWKCRRTWVYYFAPFPALKGSKRWKVEWVAGPTVVVVGSDARNLDSCQRMLTAVQSFSAFLPKKKKNFK